MAERRMFSKTVIDSDAFLEMPLSTQALYFHLSMRADDDGFLNNSKKIQRMIGASEDDLKLLMAKNFIIPFESGVVVIKHWKIHNYIQKDRYKPTVYIEEKALLGVKKNNAYTLDTECIQDVSKMDSQVRLGKDRKEKNINSPLPKKEDELLSQVVDYLNEKTGKNFRASSKSTQRHILGRIKEGYTLEDFKAVIDIKVSQWANDPKMSLYLRPETLFAGHFEGYLNEAPKKKEVKAPEVEKIDLNWQRQFYDSEEEWQKQVKEWEEQGLV